MIIIAIFIILLLVVCPIILWRHARTEKLEEEARDQSRVLTVREAHGINDIDKIQ